MLRCSNIQLNYGGQAVLHDVSLVVEPGKVTAIVGPSGAGKSTLLKVLAFLETPSSGAIALNGDTFRYPLSGHTPAPAPWPQVTAVFQQLFLWPHLTLRENITLPLRLRSVGDVNSSLDELVTRFEMEDFIDRHPNAVSGGQRQRAALARALALKPKYLLLDEITSALDVEQAASIINHLNDLKGDGIGILLITHYLGFLQRSADHIIFMEKGEIAESGGKEILSAPKSKGMMRFLDAFSQIEDRIVSERIS